MIQVYTGDGKGKTTAALGLSVRHLGAGGRPCLIQFLKSNPYSEIRFLRDKVDVFQFGSGEWVDPGHLSEADLAAARAAMDKAAEVLRSGEYSLVVLDEVNVAVGWNLVPVGDLLDLMNAAGSTELVLTGRHAHPDVIERADLVTEMREIKHYFRTGLDAREGIEF